MFDALQEGIVVLQGNQVKLMNDLSKKLLAVTFGMSNNSATMTNISDMFKNIRDKDILDQKMFFVYDHADKGDKKKKKNQQKKSSNSDAGLKSSDSSERAQSAFSLREIQKIETKELTGKIFCLSEQSAKKMGQNTA